MTTASAARAVADLDRGVILAAVDIAASPERVFAALTTPEELTCWWGSEETYRTTSWTHELRPGGKWRAEGRSKTGEAFSVEGEYLKVDPPRELVQTWIAAWDGGNTTTITYRFEPTPLGTRVTVRHEGFGERRDSCAGHANGWERVLGWLERFAPPANDAAPPAYFLCRLLGPRPTFAMDMTDEERALMRQHAQYWTERMNEGHVIVFGPVGDPAGPWGLGVVRVANAEAVRAFQEGDPVIRADRGFRYETLPMMNAVFREP